MEEFAREIAAGEVPSVRSIKRRMNVGDVKAQSYKTHIEMVGQREQVPA